MFSHRYECAIVETVNVLQRSHCVQRIRRRVGQAPIPNGEAPLNVPALRNADTHNSFRIQGRPECLESTQGILNVPEHLFCIDEVELVRIQIA